LKAGPANHARADVVAKDLGINRSLVFAMVYGLAAKIWPESDPVCDLTAIDSGTNMPISAQKVQPNNSTNDNFLPLFRA
jgi:hypothetical protein